MLPSVLVPHEIAESCYLSGALLRVAFSFPLASPTENGMDERTDPEYLEGSDERIIELPTVTGSECAAVRLTPYAD